METGARFQAANLYSAKPSLRFCGNHRLIQLNRLHFLPCAVGPEDFDGI